MERKDVWDILGDKYVLCEKAGSGGSGTVYKVYDKHLNCYRAVKQFHKEDGTVYKEMDMLKELHHPALPVVTDYLEKEHYAYLIMEYVEGKDLAAYIKENGRLEQEKAVRWTLQLAEVLIFLHERENPILYLDMKPANVMVDEKEHIRLIDFGTAYLPYHDNGEKYQGMGTYGYAAPEQLLEGGKRVVDESCDVYGLGATLFHMLTGKNPGNEVWGMQPLRFYDRRLSSRLEKIIKKAMEEKKEKRYRTVRQFKGALETYKQRERIKTRTGKIMEAFYYVFLLFLALFFFKAGGRVGKDTLLAAGSIFLLCMGKTIIEKFRCRGRRSVKLERSLLLTEKVKRGLLVIFILMSGAVCFREKEVRASEREEQTLKVEVRNERGQKLLIRYDAVYALENTLKLELPLCNFEEGEKYELRLECTNCENGETRSRTFYLKGLEP